VASRLHHLGQPIAGWMGHARPFEFSGRYEPAADVSRYLSGTPPVLSMAALEAIVEVTLEAPMDETRRKSIALCDAFIARIDERCAGTGLELASPREGRARGSHVSYRHPRSERIMQALGARGVVADCRPPDLLRFGFAPLYTTYAEVATAADLLAECIAAAAA
jgi:kynureninase